jgi:hydroxysqualene dehydroxylase
LDRGADTLDRSVTPSGDEAIAPLQVAVVGGGWAGLAAGVQAVTRGHRVTVFEMSRQWGGRARSLADLQQDNGQHILIGAYRDTLALMRHIGLDPDQLMHRLHLTLQRADGRGLHLRAGPAAPAFAAAVLRSRAWSWREKFHLLLACGRWAAARFRCSPDRSVAELCHSLPASVRELLIDPLCVAALNTPAAEASAAVFLRVLRDGLFGGPGACDLLLPCRPLHDLLPGPATRWLEQNGARVRSGTRVEDLRRETGAWQVAHERFDAVVLACSSTEAARLASPYNRLWAEQASALRFEPIVTAYVKCPGARLPAPMLALPEDAHSPAQFVFDHGVLRGLEDTYAFVVSGAAPWVEQGLEATGEAILRQAHRCLAADQWPAAGARVVHVAAERRATFRCTPGLVRPPAAIAPGLVAAGDYVDGPYPATLEGAVRSGTAAALSIERDRGIRS